MQAIRFDETGGPEVLKLERLPEPSPGPGQVTVDIAAIGVNFVDTYHRSGLYPVTLPSGLGAEAAGTIRAVGDGVTGFTEGDRVAFSAGMGAYATQMVQEADRLVPVPEDLDLEIAAAVMLQGMTAHYLTHSTASLDRDDTILIYGAAGGVGRLLIQLAKRRGARVLACTSTDEKVEVARALGADEVIRYRDVDVADTVRELTDGVGVDVVYDGIGADTWQGSLDALKRRGLAVFFGNASGPVPPLDLQVLSQKGSLVTTRPTLVHYIATRDELLWRAGSLFELIRQGKLDVSIYRRYPLDEAARAHRDLESGATAGKLLLVP